MSGDLSSLFCHLAPKNRGGLTQILSHQGGSKLLESFSGLLDSPSPTSYSLWVSDQGCLYPPSLYHLGKSLAFLLLVKAPTAQEVWRVGLEALNTGLFPKVFLRPSSFCSVSFLRKLQITAERGDTWVTVFCKTSLPHWILKRSHANALPQIKSSYPESPRSVSSTYS